MRPVYLDNNATTRTDPAVVDVMVPYFAEQFGNASSTHAFGSEVAGAMKPGDFRKGVNGLVAPVREQSRYMPIPAEVARRSGMMPPPIPR